MTALTPRTPARLSAHWLASEPGEPQSRVVQESWHLAAYEASGGYRALRRLLGQNTAPPAHDGFVVCNTDASEPGSFRDRAILRHSPHAVIEGMMIIARLSGARQGIHAIHADVHEGFMRFEEALIQARRAGLLGSHILGSDFDFDIRAVLGGGSYICGDKTALFSALEGRPKRPQAGPCLAREVGLYGRPTTVFNTETFALAPQLVSDEGVPQMHRLNTGETKLFSVSGHVNKPGVYEFPLGTPFAQLLEAAGGVREGKKLKAVIPSGPSSGVLPADIMMSCTLDYRSLGQAGSSLGSGAVIVMDETTCMVDALERLTRFYSDASCGQCSPCREGAGWIHKIVTRIASGQGCLEDLDELLRIAANLQGLTICPMGYQAAAPVESFIRHFREEFIQYITHKRGTKAGEATAVAPCTQERP
jgi:NADH-quinone oxidoreductase subunit F